MVEDPRYEESAEREASALRTVARLGLLTAAERKGPEKWAAAAARKHKEIPDLRACKPGVLTEVVVRRRGWGQATIAIADAGGTCKRSMGDCPPGYSWNQGSLWLWRLVDAVVAESRLRQSGPDKRVSVGHEMDRNGARTVPRRWPSDLGRRSLDGRPLSAGADASGCSVENRSP